MNTSRAHMHSQHYTHALPYALLSVSPSLAALHATRSHLPHHHFCPRCGQHSALHSTTVRRSAVSSVCNSCGHISHLHFDKQSTSSSFPSVKNRSRRPPPPVKEPSPFEEPVIRSNPKHKKKPGLAELLQRNRQNHSVSQPHQQQPALSAFLSTLSK